MPIKIEDLPYFHRRAAILADRRKVRGATGVHAFTANSEAYIIRAEHEAREVDNLPREWREFVYETGQAKMAIDWFWSSRTVSEARAELARVRKTWEARFASEDHDRAIASIELEL